MSSHARLERNLGGWLGAQLGGSAWILLAGLLVVSRAPGTGLVVLALFCAVNLFGLGLWRRGGALSLHAAVQLLIAALGVCGCLTIFVVDRAGLWEAIQIGERVPAGPSYAVLAAVVLGLMLFFRLRFGSGPRAGGS